MGCCSIPTGKACRLRVRGEVGPLPWVQQGLHLRPARPRWRQPGRRLRHPSRSRSHARSKRDSNLAWAPQAPAYCVLGVFKERERLISSEGWCPAAAPAAPAARLRGQSLPLSLGRGRWPSPHVNPLPAHDQAGDGVTFTIKDRNLRYLNSQFIDFDTITQQEDLEKIAILRIAKSSGGALKSNSLRLTSFNTIWADNLIYLTHR